MNNMILVNGKASEDISAYDRGLNYGDGIFETLAVWQGKCLNWPRHLARFERGCRRLSLPIPDSELLLSEIDQLCEGIERAVIKILLTRGSAGRGYAMPDNVTPNRIIMRTAWPDYPVELFEKGIRVHLCETPLGCNPILAGIKHLNRLENILARNEWSDSTISEGLMCNKEGYLVEGIMSNLFCVKDGQLITPSLDGCGVLGTIRDLLFEIANGLNINVTEAQLLPEDLANMDEAFVCNSIVGIWPIREVAQHQFAAPGEITRQCQNALKKDYFGSC